MRLATYNVEWFASLFSANDQLLINNSWSNRYNVTKEQQINALGYVFQKLNADAIMIIEAPNSGTTQSSKRALENFAAYFSLRQNKALTGFENGTQQEITLLYDPNIMQVSHDPRDAASPRFDLSFNYDLDGDGTNNVFHFSKPPLEVALHAKGGEKIRLIGVHAKSKAPHGARSKKDEMDISLQNRRKQLAQCLWIRQRVDAHLAIKDDIIVLGDFNDGPGLDKYEKLLGRSGIEIVLGLLKSSREKLYDPHAEIALHNRQESLPTTSRFYNHRTDTYLNALLDYIMVSNSIIKKYQPKWRIWHPFDNPKCYKKPKLQKALLTGSDHFPVTIDLNFKT